MSHVAAPEHPRLVHPVILVPACNTAIDGLATLTAGRKYVDAARLAGGVPLVVPNARADEIEALLALADGILLTGSPSNVHPSYFHQTVHDPALPLDPERDQWTLPLIRRALEWGIPVFAICRGMQEVNVALGGTLYQAVHELPGRLDHRDRDDVPESTQYGPAHELATTPGGLLARITGRTGFAVNSLHGQAVDRLAPGLRTEALAPDGTIEAFTVTHAPGFNLCVQWHPEWHAADNPVSMRLFEAFGQACAAHAARRAEVFPPEQ